MQFVYQARDHAGRIRQGETAAENEAEASRQLRQEGMYVLSLDEVKQQESRRRPALFQKRIPRTEIIYLTNQLAVMVEAGVPLASALDGLGKQCKTPRLKSLLETIHRDIDGGEDLSDALARFPRQFDQTYVNLVKASEASGMLGPILHRVAHQMQAELETKQKVRGALIYPAAMLVMSIAVCIFLLAYVFPQLVPMFATRALELPTPTRLLMSLSNALVNYWYGFVLAAVLAVALFLYARVQPWGRRALDWMWIHAPIVGPMLRKVAISRSLRTLATTINAGVPVLEAIELSASVSNNVFYEECWKRVGDQVTAGRQIHEALDGNRLFPPTLLQMISSGEATGKLGDVLNKVSDYFDREVSNAVKATTSLIEPIMVFMMGGIIGTIALAMLLPIFKLSSHAG